jgi:mono/diheme cytochrome c family protein
MTRARFLTLLLSFLMAGCTARKGSGPPVSADSVRTNDSALAAHAAVPVERVLSYEERQGSVLYMKYCAVCHGKEGKGDGFNAFNLDPRPRDLSDSSYMAALSDAQILQTIGGGGRSVNKSPLMPSYGWTIDSSQIRYVAVYLRTFSAGE